MVQKLLDRHKIKVNVRKFVLSHMHAIDFFLQRGVLFGKKPSSCYQIMFIMSSCPQQFQMQDSLLSGFHIYINR